jgi:predicted amidophosphoribosyltransferase
MLQAVATARRAPTTCECGAPVPWGSHFCANCGRPVGGEPVVACEGCGHPLPADATFCAHCGRAVEASQAEAEAEAYADATPEPEPEPEQAADETFLRAADPWER